MDPQLTELLARFNLTGDGDHDLAALADLAPERLDALEADLLEDFDAVRAGTRDESLGGRTESILAMQEAADAVETVRAERNARPDRIREQADTLAASIGRTAPPPGPVGPAAMKVPRAHEPAPRVRSAPAIVTRDGRPLSGLDGIAAEMAARWNDVRRGTAHGRELLTVASVPSHYPPERTLTDHDASGNYERMRAVTSPEAITASGGFCAPGDSMYGQLTIAEAARPLRDSLPRFGADRGSVRFTPPPQHADITSGNPAAAGTQQAVTVWDAATDETPGSNVKNCQTFTCPTIEEVEVQAIVRCLEFGNFMGRAYPERVRAIVDNTLAAWARTAEQELLDAISAASTANTVVQILGASRDLFSSFSQAAARYRSFHRQFADAQLRIVLPAWVPEMIRADLAQQHPGDGLDSFNVTDQQIAQWFSVRNLSPVWTLDSRTSAGQVFGPADPNTDIRNWPSEVEWFLYHEGAFVFLDGGELDLGIVRDSTLNATNDFQSFGESFEGVAFVGQESLRYRSTVCPSGEGAIDATAATCAAS